MKLIECVPNFSEGCNKEIINKICNSIESVDNITLLDVDPGESTNRTVVTFIGPPDKVIIAAYKSIEKASELIDMTKHKGQHPRMGATDVCPLIPISNITMTECVKYSHQLAEMVSKKLKIPIFMYEKSAANKDRENLSNIRSGEYENMQKKIQTPEWKPDYGNTFNANSGVTAIGAREFLIAYNVNLNTNDKKIATDIALDIRESGRAKRNKKGEILRDKNGKMLKVAGKFKHCKAVGWYLEQYETTQISINLTNYKKTSLHKVFEEIRKQARKRGVRVTGSEIVGLIPMNAMLEAGKYYLKKQKQSTGIPNMDIINIAIKSLGLNEISKFDINSKIIENRIRKDDTFVDYSINNFINEVSKGTPTPGGGSVSAMVASLGAALSAMVSNLTINKKGFEKCRNLHLKKSENCQNYKRRLNDLIDEDANAYNMVIDAIRLPKKSNVDKKYRNKKIMNANKHAAKIPLEILKVCNSLIHDVNLVAINGNPNSISDIGVSNDLIYAASKGAIYNIMINVKELNKSDQNFFNNRIEYYFKQIEDMHVNTDKFVKKTLNEN